MATTTFVIASLRTLHSFALGDQRLIQHSSFLGNGSEILISSVFEATPPPPSRFDRSNTPPKASSVTSGDHPSGSSSDDDDHHEKRKSGLPGSPLAKVFGPGRNGRPAKSKPKSRSGQDRMSHSTTSNPTAQASSDEVEKLKLELSEVRASQLRMEDMLSKMLSGTGVDDK